MGVEYKDYYKILGVPRTATDKEIRAAYRKLAREHHPDVNAGDAEKFKDINEAYEALKDPERRRLYDNLGPQWRQGQNYTPPPGFNDWQGSVNLNDLGGMGGFSSFFEALFGGGAQGFGGAGFPGGDMGGRYSAGRSGRRSSRGAEPREAEPTEQTLYLDLEEVASGVNREIQTPSGKRLTVSIPKGVKEGSKIRLAGEGSVGRYGIPGDLLLVVKYREHKHFKVEGAALVYEAPVPVPDFVLGGEIRVPSFSGEVSMRIPPGTQPGRLMRLKGQGLPGREGQAGDLLVRPRAVIPAHPSEREKALYRELRECLSPTAKI